MKRLRALADKRQKEAAREGRLTAQGLLGAADGYRALADALERQPSLSWLQPKPQDQKAGPQGRNPDSATRKLSNRDLDTPLAPGNGSRRDV